MQNGILAATAGLGLVLGSCAPAQNDFGHGPPEPWAVRVPEARAGQIEVAAGVSLRGVSAPSFGMVWASGSAGCVLRSAYMPGHMAPETQMKRVDPVADSELDFRMLWAFDGMHAWAGSSGPGEASRLFETTDAGASWNERLVNKEPEGFWDSLAFWDEQNGLMVGDAVDGYLTVMRTSDGGKTWARVAREFVPESPSMMVVDSSEEAPEGSKLLIGEVCFAASNRSIALGPDGMAWIGTGGSVARVWKSDDFGASWEAVESGLRSADGASGVFAVAFDPGGRRGVAVGGKYDAPDEVRGNFAWAPNGGDQWFSGGEGGQVPPAGYRSAVAYATRGEREEGMSDGDFYGSAEWISVGTNGISVAASGGLRWSEVVGVGGGNAVAVFDRFGFVVGRDGGFVVLGL